LKVVAKAIVQLKFYSGSSMGPATVWIVSGLRSRRTNDTAPALAAELFFSWTWLRFRGSLFHGSDSSSGFRLFLHINIL